MSTLTDVTTIISDTTLDPGPAPGRGESTGAARKALAAAIATGQLTAPERVATALAALEEARAAHVDHAVHRNLPRGLEALTGRVALDMLAGKTRPTAADLTTAVLAAEDEDRAYKATSEHLERLRNRLDVAVGTVLEDATDTMLEGIRDTVEQVVTRAAKARTTLAGLDLTTPEAVAGASVEQRKAIASLPDLAREYNRARLLQRLIYAATGRPRPGYSDSDHTGSWAPVYERGVHEFQRITLGDSGPSLDLPARTRILAVANRQDVWVPTPDQIEGALGALAMPATERFPSPNRHSDAGRQHKMFVRGATALERVAGQ